MIKFNEIKTGDYLIADNDGDQRLGEVTNLNHNEKQVCVDTILFIADFPLFYLSNQQLPLL